jgi:hypothetical protein
MDVKFRYRGREITRADVDFLKSPIAEETGSSRRALSKKVCEVWNWAQPNGELRDRVCRSLMLELDRAGLITLPPVRCRPPNNGINRPVRATALVEATPLRATWSELQPLEFCQVRRTEHESLFRALLQSHHYLGYTRPVGECRTYLVYTKDRPVACFAGSSAPRRLAPRDRLIGGSAPARCENIHAIAYHTRFLVLPWIEVPHLASPLLGRMAKRLRRDWKQAYAHPLYYRESFVDPERFYGTCYRAANGRFLGRTTGRGKADQMHWPNRSCNEVLGDPLTKHFRSMLCRNRPD